MKAKSKEDILSGWTGYCLDGKNDEMVSDILSAMEEYMKRCMAELGIEYSEAKLKTDIINTCRKYVSARSEKLPVADHYLDHICRLTSILPEVKALRESTIEEMDRVRLANDARAIGGVWDACNKPYTSTSEC